MEMKDYLKNGYVQVAESSLSGTGGIRITALEKRVDGKQLIQLFIENPNNRKADKNFEININEVSTLAHILDDLMYLNKLRK